MQKIKPNIEILNEIRSLYDREEIQKDLKNAEEKISFEMNRLFKENAKDYELSASHSVHTDNYYHLVSRVKKPKSLFEKFIRKSIGLSLITQHQLCDLESVRAKEKELEKSLKLVDDIIGIRVVTELQLDCIQAYKLLRDNQAYLGEKHIKFSDIDQQPQRMKNGLKIYNIKGTYLDEVAFELQIKSKINAAWGDIDHALFYKDYSVSPIKDTVQVSINRIGMLLEELESFLFDLRKSNNDYEEKAERNKYLQRFDAELSPLLKSKFDIAYDITKIAEPLIFIIKSLNPEPPQLTELQDDILTHSSDDPQLKRYQKIRGNDFELILIEIIYFNWKSVSAQSNITQENYSTELLKFIDEIRKYIASKIAELNESSDSEEAYIFVANLMKKMLEYSDSPKIILGYREYIECNKICEFIKENMDDLSNVSSADVDNLCEIFSVSVFNGDINACVRRLYAGSNPEEIKSKLYSLRETTERRQSLESADQQLLKSIIDKSQIIIDTLM